MKKMLFVCCILMGMSAVSQAQKMFIPETRAKQLQTLLKLSDTQTSKITGYYKTLIVQMDSVIKAGGNGDAFNPLMADTKTKIKNVLTPEQNVGYEKMLQEQVMRQKEENADPQKEKGDAGAGSAPKEN